MNPKNDDDHNCFQYAVKVVLNHENIGKDPIRLYKIKPFVKQYNWKELNFPSHKKNWKRFESNDKSIDLNAPHKGKNKTSIQFKTQSKARK